MPHSALQKFIEHYHPIVELSHIQSILDWDLNVNLPAKAVAARARQSALLAELITGRWQDPEMMKRFEELQQQTNLSKTEQRLVRMLQRTFKVYRQVPKELIVTKSHTASEAFMAWQEARHKNQFNLFLPHLAKLIDLDRRMADHLGYEHNPYDALLDQYDAGLTAAFCQEIFRQIQPPITDLVAHIAASPNYVSDHPLLSRTKRYANASQRKLGLAALHRMGYDFTAGRLDVAPHPFSTDLGWQDTRITTRYLPHDFRSALSATMHEGGHALYTQGIPEDVFNLMAGEGDLSFSIHESQSRFWENHVGRSPQFLRCIAPLIQGLFPDQIAWADSKTIIEVFNLVTPGAIRIEADEVTYPLHITLRFELENDLINGNLQPADIPEAWNAKMQQYLGVTPETDSQGCLQDVHWSYGNFGYFPTYALGTLYAAQFAATMQRTLDVATLLAHGELAPILAWLRAHIHQHGPLYTADELAQQVTGESLNPRFFLDYLQDKYGQLYGLENTSTAMGASHHSH